jgi:CheY-like chemotaxis protein
VARPITAHTTAPDCTPSGRIIAVTGYGQDADRQRASEAGFDAHLVKPVTLDVLIEALGERAAE